MLEDFVGYPFTIEDEQAASPAGPLEHTSSSVGIPRKKGRLSHQKGDLGVGAPHECLQILPFDFRKTTHLAKHVPLGRSKFAVLSAGQFPAARAPEKSWLHH